MARHQWNLKVTNKDHIRDHQMITVQDYAPGQEGLTAQFAYRRENFEDGDVLSSNLDPKREQDAISFLHVHGYI